MPYSPQPSDLVLLADVKTWLDITTTTSDDELQRLLSSCSLFMQKFMNRTIIATAYNDSRSGPGAGCRKMVMGNFPIVSVSLVSVDGVAIPLAVNWGDAGYYFDDNTIYLNSSSFTRGNANCRFQYTAGYATVPMELSQACIETVADRWKKADRIGQVSKGLAGETTAFSLKDFPAEVLTLMNNYKKVVSI